MTELNYRTVRLGNFSTSYIEYENPGAPVAVLVHDGLFGTTAELCWGSTAHSLSATHHVYALDLLGWGGSDKAVYFDRPPFLPRAEQLAEFCKTLSINDALFIGVSFGATVILRALVSSSIGLPASQVIALSGTGGPFRTAEGITALADYDKPSVEAARRLTELVTDNFDGIEAHAEVRYQNSLIPGHWESLMAPRLSNPAVTSQRASDDLFSQLAATQTPITYIEGINDPLLEDGWAQKMADTTAHGTAIQLECGHEPNIDQPELLMDTLKRIL